MSLGTAKYLLEVLPRIHPMREKNGYIQIKMEGKWRWFHRVIAEEKMGSDIYEGHEVHHIDGDKQNNHPSNLKVLSKENHRELHRQQRKEEEGIRKPNDKTVKALISKSLHRYKEHHAALKSRSKLNEILSIQRLHKTVSRMRWQGSTSQDTYTLQGLSRLGPCTRCGGTGYLSEYSHVEGGVCFSCGGTGRQ